MPSTTLKQQDVGFSIATLDDIPEIVAFTKTARTDMFTMLDAASHEKHAKNELAGGFQKLFIDLPDGAFLIARLKGTIVATIGYVPYDNRFSHFQLDQDRTVEVVRLYVNSNLRRCGLASQLFRALKETAHGAGIGQFYLHTHPFLPGALTFWERNGFETICRDDDDEVWRTIHMKMPLDGRIAKRDGL